MVRFAEEKDLVRVNELRKQVNDVHVKGRPDIFRPGFCKEMQGFLYAMFYGENHNIIVAERDGIICGIFATLLKLRWMKISADRAWEQNFLHL